MVVCFNRSTQFSYFEVHGYFCSQTSERRASHSLVSNKNRIQNEYSCGCLHAVALDDAKICPLCDTISHPHIPRTAFAACRAGTMPPLQSFHLILCLPCSEHLFRSPIRQTLPPATGGLHACKSLNFKCYSDRTAMRDKPFAMRKLCRLQIPLLPRASHGAARSSA
jgi:hypothetical protein